MSTLYFVVDRETKGAIRYQEVSNEGRVLDLGEYAIGTLYVRKSALPGGPLPRALTVRLEFVKEAA